MPPANKSLHRKVSASDIIHSIFWCCLIFGFFLLKYIFPKSPFVQKYFSGIGGVINFAILVIVFFIVELKIFKKNNDRGETINKK
jgi:hypothetical protein